MIPFHVTERGEISDSKKIQPTFSERETLTPETKRLVPTESDGMSRSGYFCDGTPLRQTTLKLCFREVCSQQTDEYHLILVLGNKGFL